jgi:hypothetical protein
VTEKLQCAKELDQCVILLPLFNMAETYHFKFYLQNLLFLTGLEFSRADKYNFPLCTYIVCVDKICNISGIQVIRLI